METNIYSQPTAANLKFIQCMKSIPFRAFPINKDNEVHRLIPAANLQQIQGDLSEACLYMGWANNAYSAHHLVLQQSSDTDAAAIGARLMEQHPVALFLSLNIHA